MKYIIDTTLEVEGDVNFINLIKAVRTALAVGLKEAKHMADAMRESVAHVRLTPEQYGLLVVTFKAFDLNVWTRIDKVHTENPDIQFDFSKGGTPPGVAFPR